MAEEQENLYDGEGYKYDFPVEEVRLTIPPTDDTSLPVLTFRTWVLGIPICCFLSAMNVIFGYRRQAVYISTVCVDMLLLFTGKFMANMLPNKIVRIPWTRWTFSINPGPFHIKEHALISIFASSAYEIPLAVGIITLSKVFYHKKIQMLPSILLVLSTQMTGYGFAGIFMKLLVYSPYMWWPGTLVQVSFYRALHVRGEREKGQVTKFQFFLIVTVSSFVYAIGPTYFFPSISTLSFICWIWKDSVQAQQIGSGLHGLGLGSFGLDWMSISSFLGSPMAMPTSVIVNTMVGFILFTYVMIPISYWTNAHNAKRFPIVSYNMFDAKGQPYNVSRIMDANFEFDKDAYNDYSKLYLSTLFLYNYGFTFASLTSSICHAALFYGRTMWNQFGIAYKSKEEDIHTKLMKKNYDRVPQWWFYFILVSMICLAIVTCEVFKEQFQLSYWGVLLAVTIVFIFIIPYGVLNGTANLMPDINVLLELIIAYLDPGKPFSNLTFKIYGFSSLSAAIGFSSDFKLGHYLKIPPKSMFLAQILGTTLSSFIYFAVSWWMLDSIKNICHPELLPKGSPWTCPNDWAQYNVAITFSAVGPQRMFYPNGIYAGLFLFFIIGLLAPVPAWILSRLYPEKKWISLINFPVIFMAGSNMPPATPTIYWSWFIVGILFNYVVFRKYKGWWVKYNYVLSTGLDCGTALMALLGTASLNLEGIYGINWWGLDFGDHCPLAHCPTFPGIEVEGCPIIH